ncbi:hypothetical protein Q3G72_017057 [Acer saccharum]|nr:hypothetical protein Q3G72_017057 [Acer saccharum]
MRESVYLLLTVKFGNISKEGFSHYKEPRGLASPDRTQSPQLAGSAPRSRLCNNQTSARKIINKIFKTNSIEYGHVYNMDIGPKRVGVSIFSLDMETVCPCYLPLPSLSLELGGECSSYCSCSYL